MLGSHMGKYMLPIEYEAASPLCKSLFDMVNGFKILEILADNKGKQIKNEIVIQPIAGDVEAISGNNYKINVFSDRYDILTYSKVNQYSLVEAYKEFFNKMNFDFEDKTKSIGYGSFDMRFVIHFTGEPDQEVLMELFKFLNIN